MSSTRTSHPLGLLPYVPESWEDIRETVRGALDKSGERGRPPTDLAAVAETAGVEIISGTARQRYEYLRSLPSPERSCAREAFGKIKGIADLQEKAIWVPDDLPPERRAFPLAHELAHHLLPWHEVPGRTLHADSSGDMQMGVQDLFEREANFGAAELIFQCGLLRERSSGKEPSLQVPISLAETFCASYQSAIIRHAATSDTSLAVGIYYRKSEDKSGEGPHTEDCLTNGAIGAFDHWRSFVSPGFASGPWEADFPREIDKAHPWARATLSDEVIDVQVGESAPCPISPAPGGQMELGLKMEAWCNHHSLFLLACIC